MAAQESCTPGVVVVVLPNGDDGVAPPNKPPLVGAAPNAG